MAKLTKRVIDAAELREKDYVIWDDDLPGFGLRVFASGKRSYLIHMWTPPMARAFCRDRCDRLLSYVRPVYAAL